MVNKAVFVGLSGAIAPSVTPLDPPL